VRQRRRGLRARRGGDGVCHVARPDRLRLAVAAKDEDVAMTAAQLTIIACTACFQAEETAMIDGAKLGIIVMLGITLAVQGAFLAFFLYLRRHARRVAEVDLDVEWAQFQRGSTRS